MPNAEITTVLQLLRAAMGEPSLLLTAIKNLQNVVWKSETWYSGLSEPAAEALRDLAYDLDYYEPIVTHRAEDPSFFGEERALKEIADALARVESTLIAG